MGLINRLKNLLTTSRMWLASDALGQQDGRSQLPGKASADAAGDLPPVRHISSLAELDKVLDEVDQAFQQSDDAGRRRLAQFRYLLDGQFPADPYSPEYAQAQWQQYFRLSGRTTYEPAINEHSALDVEQAVRSPFPYSTQSPATVGEQLIAQGFLIRTMDLRPAARIVEFGPGWGNTTIQLAQMGHRVTAVEIEPNFVNLIRRRAELLGLNIELVQQDMLQFSTATPYDAALFFECFHHCSDHLRLLRQLHTIVAPDGFVAFAAEPIDDYPLPWGFVRTDGLTIWSIRRMGWFELGFDSSYFLRTLLRLGWLPRRYTSSVSLSANVIIAHRSQGIYNLCELTLPPDEAATWAAPEADHRFTSAQSVLSCDASPQVSAVEVCLSNPAPFELIVTLTAGEASRQVAVPKHTERLRIRVDARQWGGQVRIGSSTWVPAHVFGTADQRILGVAVHQVRLIT